MVLRDLFLALLGFAGDVLVEEGNTIRVRDGFDLLTLAEREQVNRVAPLGWYYLRLSAFVDEYDLKWGGRGKGRHFQAYRTAMSLGVLDLLNDYASDVAYLEQIVLADGPLPLSQVLLHLQKYLMTMPAIYAICDEMERRNICGCRILDFLAHYQSGVPVVMHTVQHMLFRVRAVFLKQCLAWMVYGELDDPGREFFIQVKSSAPGGGTSTTTSSGANSSSSSASTQSSIHDEVRSRLARAFERSENYSSSSSGGGGAGGGDGAGARNQLPFDWNSTYLLRLELLPESHVTPRMASRILFAGKAAKLLHSSAGLVSAAASAYMVAHGAVYSYLASGPARGGRRGRPGEGAGDGEGGRESEGDGEEEGEGEGAQAQGLAAPSASASASATALLHQHAAACGYSPQDLDRFTAGFKDILQCPEHATLEALEQLVEDVHATVSAKVWRLLRDDLAFDSFLGAIRNTYLMGKGELFQLILDGVSAQMRRPVVDSRKANVALNWGVVRQAAKLLDLDDDSMAAIFRLRVNSPFVSIQPQPPSMSGQQGTTQQQQSPYEALDEDNEFGITTAGSARLYSNKSHATSSSFAAAGPGSSRPRLALVTPPAIDFQSLTSGVWESRVLLRAADFEARRMAEAQAAAAAASAAANSSSASAADARSAQAVRNRLWIRSVGAAPSQAATADATLAAAATAAKDEQPLRYSVGAAWMSDHKYVVKGFSLQTAVLSDWTAARRFVTSGHPGLAAAASSGAGVGAGAGGAQLRDSLGSLPSTISAATSKTFVTAASSAAALPQGQQQQQQQQQLVALIASSSLVLGCVSATVHSDRLGCEAVGSGSLGADLSSSVSVGVSFHAVATSSSSNSSSKGAGGVRFFARLFVAVKRDGASRFTRSGGVAGAGTEAGIGGASSAASVDGSADFGAAAAALGSGSINGDLSIIAEKVFALDEPSSAPGSEGAGLRTSAALSLEVEYTRELSSGVTGGGSLIAGAVHYRMQARLREAGAAASGSFSQSSFSSSSASVSGSLAGAGAASAAGSGAAWDISVPLDLSNHVKLRGGQAVIGLTSSGLILQQPHAAQQQQAAPAALFGTDLYSLHLRSKGALATYPVASSFTSARHPETFVRLEAEVAQIRAWLGIHLQFRFPAMFSIVFDSEALSAYERIFSFTMKIRLVAHSLERLWKSRSRLSSDRSFCQLRHSMHFFAANLLYYLQVDVVDSEFLALQRDVEAASDFQMVVRAHRNFIAAVLRVSLVDHLTVQEGVERVLQACLRFIAVCRLLQQQEGVDDDDNNYEGGGGGGQQQQQQLALSSLLLAPSPNSRVQERVRSLPVAVPPEELEAVRKEFFSQIAFLFQVMRKIESRGFVFRLDFNSFLSEVSEQGGAGPLVA